VTAPYAGSTSSGSVGVLSVLTDTPGHHLNVILCPKTVKINSRPLDNKIYAQKNGESFPPPLMS
jgi:hypothetical protein